MVVGALALTLSSSIHNLRVGASLVIGQELGKQGGLQAVVFCSIYCLNILVDHEENPQL